MVTAVENRLGDCNDEDSVWVRHSDGGWRVGGWHMMHD